MTGAVKLLTAGSGGINLQPASSIASDVTVNVPSQNCTLDIQGPAFSAYQTTPQSLSSGTFTNLQCQTEVFDTNGCFNNTGSTVTLNGISTPAYAFAPNVAGYYQFNLHLNCTLATSQELITSIYKNGFSVNYVSDVIGGLTRSSNGSYLIYLNGTSDYVQSYGYINTNATISIAYFQGFMVKAA